MTKAYPERLNVPITEDLLKRIDDWRRHESDIPPRASAARRLIEAALDAAEKAKGEQAKPTA